MLASCSSTGVTAMFRFSAEEISWRTKSPGLSSRRFPAASFASSQLGPIRASMMSQA